MSLSGFSTRMMFYKLNWQVFPPFLYFLKEFVSFLNLRWSSSVVSVRVSEEAEATLGKTSQREFLTSNRINCLKVRRPLKNTDMAATETAALSAGQSPQGRSTPRGGFPGKAKILISLEVAWPWFCGWPRTAEMVPLQLASSNLALGVDLRLTGKPPPGRLLNFRKFPFVVLVELFWENCWRVGERTWWVRASGCPKPSLTGRHHRVSPRLQWARHGSRKKKAQSWGWKLLASECPRGTRLTGKRKRLQAPVPGSQSRSEKRTCWETAETELSSF